MAEIGFAAQGGQRIASERFYVWPLYNAGRVENIHGVARRTESNILYAKPSPEDRNRIMDLAKDRSFSEYSPSGRIGRTRCGSAAGGPL